MLEMLSRFNSVVTAMGSSDFARLHLAALSMTRVLRVIAVMSVSPSRLPRELSLRSHVKVYGVGILLSGADEHVSQAKLHKISVGKDNLKLRRADEPGALRNVVPEDDGISAEISPVDGHGEGHAIDRHSARRELH